MENLFPLNLEEIRCVIKISERVKVTHVVKPPKLDDWLAFEAALQISREVQDGMIRVDDRSPEAAEALWNRVALRVESYRVNGVDMMTIEGDWKKLVPVPHKALAAGLLAQVFVGDDDAAATDNVEEADLDLPFDFNPESVTVQLVAGRNGVEFRALAHAFRRPESKHFVRFSRATARAMFVRGSKTSRSLQVSDLKSICALYDELVISTSGYSDNGDKRLMDAMHKKAATMALFAPVEAA